MSRPWGTASIRAAPQAAAQERVGSAKRGRLGINIDEITRQAVASRKYACDAPRLHPALF